MPKVKEAIKKYGKDCASSIEEGDEEQQQIQSELCIEHQKIQERLEIRADSVKKGQGMPCTGEVAVYRERNTVS